MQAMILAGGLGTRISEESAVRPKPMVEIGGRPIIWHIMKMYLAHGVSDFVICCGYKGHLIKQFFRDYAMDGADITFDMRDSTTTMLRTSTEPWKVTLVDTGLDTMTGGRIRRAARYLNDGPFCCTYGDGVSDVDITKLMAFHRAQGVLATVTAVQPPGRFGAFNLHADNALVPSFKEKPGGDGAWINGGFFVCQPEVFDYIRNGDTTIWEQDPLQNIAKDGQLVGYKHEGFWRPMDTLKDKQDLNEMWNTGSAKWKIWK